MIENIFDLNTYHWVWYIIGFIIAPRLTLAIIVTIYTPIALWLKILMWIEWLICLPTKKENNTTTISLH